MKDLVTKTIKELPYSGIRKFFDIASQMEDIISLGVGEPDFPTPQNICEKAIVALQQERTKYTANAGSIVFREEISSYMLSNFGLNYKANSEVLVTVGASQGIDLAIRAVIETGDEVLICEPCFVSYNPCVKMAGGVPVAVPTYAENGFKPTAADIESRITEKTKALIISFPNNPTGAILEKDDLESISEILRDKDIVVISDESYAQLTYGNKGHFCIASFERMKDKTVVLHSLSKSFAMTGWRIGFACGAKNIIDAMTKIHQYAIMCAPTIGQYAGIEALKYGAESVNAMRNEYDTRRQYMLREFRRMGMDCFDALGAFYLFPSIKRFGLTSEEFCERLLIQERLAVVPGRAFGECGEGHIRCSYAYSLEKITAAMQKLERFIKPL